MMSSPPLGRGREESSHSSDRPNVGSGLQNSGVTQHGITRTTMSGRAACMARGWLGCGLRIKSAIVAILDFEMARHKHDQTDCLCAGEKSGRSLKHDFTRQHLLRPEKVLCCRAREIGHSIGQWQGLLVLCKSWDPKID